MTHRAFRAVLLCALVPAMACRPDPSSAGAASSTTTGSPIEAKLGQYTTVPLTTDLSKLSQRERQMLPLLIAAARSMDEIFWRQAYGDRQRLVARVQDSAVRRYVEINY